MVDLTPAASNAFLRNGRSTVSHRTDDLESGSSTATLPEGLLLLLLLLLESPDLLLSLPHAATVTARAATLAQSAIRFHLNLTSFLLVGWSSGAAPDAPRDARTAVGPGRARRAPAPAPPGRPPRPVRPPRPARSRTGSRPLASGRGGGRPPRPGLRPRPPCRG